MLASVDSTITRLYTVAVYQSIILWNCSRLSFPNSIESDKVGLQCSFRVRFLQNPDLRIKKCLTWCWIHIKMFKKALLMTRVPCYRDYDINRVRRMETGVYLVRVHHHQALLLSMKSLLRDLFT